MTPGMLELLPRGGAGDAGSCAFAIAAAAPPASTGSRRRSSATTFVSDTHLFDLSACSGHAREADSTDKCLGQAWPSFGRSGHSAGLGATAIGQFKARATAVAANK